MGGGQSCDPHQPHSSIHTTAVWSQGRTPWTAAPHVWYPPADPQGLQTPMNHSPPPTPQWGSPPPSCAIGITAHLWARRDTVTHPITSPKATPPPQPAEPQHSRVSFLWALGGGLQTPGSFSPPALSTGLAVGGGGSPPAPGGSLGGGGGVEEGLPGGSVGLEAGGAADALGGVLGAALSPSGLGRLGIFSRFTTGMNKLGRNGAVRGGASGTWGGVGQRGGHGDPQLCSPEVVVLLCFLWQRLSPAARSLSFVPQRFARRLPIDGVALGVQLAERAVTPFCAGNGPPSAPCWVHSPPPCPPTPPPSPLSSPQCFWKA